MRLGITGLVEILDVDSIGVCPRQSFTTNALVYVGNERYGRSPTVLVPTLHPLAVTLSMIWDDLHINHSIS